MSGTQPGTMLVSVATIVIIMFSGLLFADDDRPHVVFIAGEEEYGAHWALPKIADDLQRRYNIRSTVLHSWRSGVDDYDMPGVIPIPEYEAIPGLEAIKDADLIVMHIRFRIPPPEQYDLLQEYFDAGKPAIAFRTTSHGFWPADRKDWFVPFFGGHYKGHMPNTEGTTTMVPAEQLDHPILRGVPKRRSWHDIAGVYMAGPLNDTATPLMMGKTGLIGPAQPVSWVNEYKPGQKIFYTSLGGLESFVHPDFINMVYNAVYWALDREVPENGVLGINDISDLEPVAFERFSFGALMENPFGLSEEALMLENSVVLDAAFTPAAIPAPPALDSPKNATVLFAGSDVSQWRHWDPSADPIAMLPDARAVSPSPPFPVARWNVVDGALEARPGYGSLLTRKTFGNYRLHLDFLIPEEPDYVPARFKGSGSIFLDGRYEIKLLDSYGQEPSDVGNGSIFGQIAPSSNASKPVNTWQSLDIEFRNYVGQRPQMSVMLNGKKIHDNVTVMSRAHFAIREADALYVSSQKDAAEKYNMNRDNWAAQIEFRTLDNGYLLTNAPENAPWNEDSKGWLIHDEALIYQSGEEYALAQEEEGAVSLADGQWHTLILSAKDGTVTSYINGKQSAEFENSGAAKLQGHVLRIGQSTKIYRLGASALPDPYGGPTFNGEIRMVRFFKQALDETAVQRINSGDMPPKKSLSLDWHVSKQKKVVQNGPIRLQADLSKIRYANIWLAPLDE